MPTEIAEVETLVAEVRTLMVGSRQVTMSVFNQLDECRDLIPFGRVRCKEPGLWLVGKHPDSGALVRLQNRYPSLPYAEDGPDAWKHFLAHHAHHAQHKLKLKEPRFCVATGRSGTELVWAAHLHYKCPDGTHGRCPADVQALQAEWERIAADEMERYDAEVDEYEALNELPLIVLAGLR
jgi:hypothetical protein